MMKRINPYVLRALVIWVPLALNTGCYVSKDPPIPPPQISSQELNQEEISPPPVKKKAPKVKAVGSQPRWQEDHPALREPVSIAAFNLPLANVLQSLIEPSKLNLEIKENVDLKKPVTLKSSGSSLGRALIGALSPLGYSFRAEGETLVVFETDTKTFRLSIPGLIQDYTSTITNQSTTSVGQTGTAATGGVITGGTAGTGTQSVGATLGSEVTVRTSTDKADIWKIVDDNLKSMVTPPGRYSVDRVGGNIVVTAKAPVLENVRKYVEYLEGEYSRQARFDVQILEVSVTDKSQFGVDWTKVYQSLIAHNAVSVRTNNALTFGLDTALPSFTLTSRSAASNIVIQALRAQGNVKLLSQPKVLVRNNMVAVISVGEVIPFISNVSTIVTTATTTSNPTLSSVQAGVVLSITPKINGDGTMMLHLSPIVSRVTSFENFTVGTTSFRAPRLDTRNLSTMVNVRDGETFVLGGLITQNVQRDTRRIPLLSDIPLLGGLAGEIIDSDSRNELVIVLTPKVETLSKTP